MHYSRGAGGRSEKETRQGELAHSDGTSTDSRGEDSGDAGEGTTRRGMQREMHTEREGCTERESKRDTMTHQTAHTNDKLDNATGSIVLVSPPYLPPACACLPSHTNIHSTCISPCSLSSLLVVFVCDIACSPHTTSHRERADV